MDNHANANDNNGQGQVADQETAVLSVREDYQQRLN